MKNIELCVVNNLIKLQQMKKVKGDSIRENRKIVLAIFARLVRVYVSSDNKNIRPLQYYEQHPLLKHVVDKLVVNMSKEKIVTFMEISILMAKMVDSLCYNIGLKERVGLSESWDDMLLLVKENWIETDDISENESNLIPQNIEVLDMSGLSLLKEVSVLLNCYDKYQENLHCSINYDDFPILLSASDDWLINLSYEPINHIDLFYKINLEYMFNAKDFYEILYPVFASSYINGFPSDFNPYYTIYEALIEGKYIDIHGCEHIRISIKDYIDKCSSNLNEVILTRIMPNPLAFCFMVAFIKANNIFPISVTAILNGLSKDYIDAFKSLWWKCEVYGHMKLIIEDNPYSFICHNFEERLEDCKKIKEIQEEDISLEPPADYLVITEIKTSSVKKQRTSKKGRPSMKFEDLIICTDDPKIKAFVIKEINRLFPYKSNVSQILLLCAAVENKILKKLPTYNALDEVINGELLAEAGFHDIKNRSKNYKECEHYKDEYNYYNEEMKKLKVVIDRMNNEK